MKNSFFSEHALYSNSRLRNDLYCLEWDVKFYYTIQQLISSIIRHIAIRVYRSLTCVTDWSKPAGICRWTGTSNRLSSAAGEWRECERYGRDVEVSDAKW